MKRKLNFLFAILLVASSAKADWPTGITGDGLTEATAYQIKTVADLAALASYVNAGNGDATKNKYYKLMNDLDLQGWGNAAGWIPIGNNNTNTDVTRFQGIFDGNNHVIKNMTIARPSESYMGLFGYTDGDTIRNIGVENCTITGDDYIGGLVGNNFSTSISNSYITGSVSGNTHVGGLVGNNNSSTISNSYSISSVKGVDIAGGLVGYNNSSTINNSYSTGHVSGNITLGGLVGENNNSSIVQNCVAANASVISKASTTINRVVGRNHNGSISHNNYALSSMVVDDNGLPVTTDGAGIYGVSKTLAELQRNSFYSAVDGTWYNNTAWSITPAAGAIWTIWDTKSYPYFVSQSAPVYNPVTIRDSLSFELRNAVTDSVLVYNARTKVVTKLTNLASGINTKAIVVQEGDTLSITAYEPAKSGSYPVQTIVINSMFCGGDGLTEATAYQICDTTSLGNLARYVNAGNGNATKNKYYKLMNDLDLQGWGGNHSRGWVPIGSLSGANAFQGIFDGNNHVIKNIFIYREMGENIGFFGYTEGDTIRNIGLVDCDIYANDEVGGLVGTSSSSVIINSYTTGRIWGCQHVGGLVGTSSSSVIINSYSTSSIKGCENVGGLVGDNNSSSISNSYSTGDISVESVLSGNIGGLVGINNSSPISNSYSTGSVCGAGSIGGLVGYNNSSPISNSYSIGSVLAIGSGVFVGGLVGINNSSIIRNSVAANTSVIATQAAAGINRIVGSNNGGGNTYDNNYALSSMVVDNAGTPVTTDGGGIYGISQTLAELQRNSFYSAVDATWYNNTAWSITPAGGAIWTIWDIKSYPYFVSQSAPVYNPVTIKDSLSFELRNAVTDSVLVYNARTKVVTKFTNLASGINTKAIVVQEGDTLSITAYEPAKSGSYPVQAIVINSMFCGGDGLTEATAYQICDTTSLANLARYVNAGNGDATKNKYYKLMNDLDLQGWGNAAGWIPIGNNNTNTNVTRFQGIFDGNNHVIKNMTIARPSESDMGFFGYTEGDTIRNIGLVDCDIYANDWVGGLVGTSSSSVIINSYTTGRIWGCQHVGGLVGTSLSSVIINSYSTSSIKGCEYVGGLMGDNAFSSISNSYSTGSVCGTNMIGGLVGENSVSTISHSYSIGSVLATGSGAFVGGLVGINNSDIRSSVAANASVIATQATGGINRIVGSNNGITGMHNYALSSMVVDNAGTPVTTDGGGIYGISQTLAELQRNSFYSAADATWYNNTAWSITPAAGAIWTIWDTKSYPYFVSQSAPAYNAQHTLSSLIFELRNAASVNIYKNDTLFATHAGTVGVNTVNRTFVATDTISIEVIETGKTVSYFVQSVLIDEIIFGINTLFTYNGTGQTPTATATSARTITWLYKTQGVDDNTYTATLPVNAGSYTARASIAPDANYILITVDSIDFSITAKAITVAAIAETISYGQTPTLAYSVNPPFIHSDTMSGALAVDNLEIGTHTINQGSLTAGNNYTLTYNSAILTVLSVSTDIKVIIDGQEIVEVNNEYRTNTEKSSVEIIIDAPGTNVAINGQPAVPSGTPAMVSLNYGQNTIPVVVVAQNGNTHNYEIIIERYYDQIVYEFSDVPTINCNKETNGGYNLVAFQWYKDDVVIKGATKPYYQIKDNATYYCIITLDNGTIWHSIQVQDAALHSVINLTAYPNPTKGKLTVESGELKVESEIQVFDMQGKKVFETAKNPFDISHLPQGTYVIKMDGKTVKIIKK